MTTTFNITSVREAFLQMTDVTQDNVFSFASALMRAVRTETLTTRDMDWIIYEFERHCKSENISTKIFS
jgi:hypothetical protein